MVYLVLPVMGLLAGAWILPLLRGEFSLSSRLALCVALSPFVVAVQFLLLGFLGVAFPALAYLLLVINLIPGWFIGRELLGPRAIGAPRDLAFKLLAAAVPVSWILASWWEIPGLRAFGWHNLMHADIVYQLARSPLLPGEPELAGLPLAYSWLGHTHWTVVALLADLPPTRVYPALNFMLLGALMVLLHNAARRLGIHPAFATLAAVVGVLGNNLVRQIGVHTSVSADALAELAGEIRLISPLTKFRYLDLMPVSFALFGAILWLWAARDRLTPKSFALLNAVLLCGAALLYPVGFPAAVCVGGLVVLVEWFVSESDRGAILHRTGLVAGGMVLSIVCLAAWSGTTAMGASGEVAEWKPLEVVAARALHLCSAIGPFVLLAAPAIPRGLRERNAFVLGCALAVAVLSSVYLFFSVRDVEYKYILYARLCLGLLAAYGIDGLCRGWQRGRWPLSFAVVAVLGLLSLWGVGNQSRPGWSLANAPAIDESHFRLGLARDSPGSGWVRAIKEQTSADTVVLANGVAFHAGTFLDRDLYFPCEISSVLSAGYTLKSYHNLVTMRGHARETYARRGEVVRSLYTSRWEGQPQRVLESLLALERPVAIRFPASWDGFARWSERNDKGRVLYRDRHNLVLLIDPQSGRSGEKPTTGG